jgi:hypothetical protein
MPSLLHNNYTNVKCFFNQSLDYLLILCIRGLWEIADKSPQQQSADIFSKLKVRKDKVPIRPLTEGKLE